jgi:acetolactate synthase-1/2/3 large subunit
MSDVDKISVARAVVEALKAEKVEFVFGLAGSHMLLIFDALVDAPQIRHIVVKHESNAAFMAGMYGYLTGRPGVTLVTAGPGATNSISGVVQAYAQSLPLVHITGDVPLGSGNETFHGVDREDFLCKMFADVTKWSVRVERAEEIPQIMSRAFALAASGRPGPVHVAIPLNIVQTTDAEMSPYRSSPVEKQTPPKELIERARQALAEARRPMLCAGRGVMVHRAEAELIELAEAVSAPMLCSANSLGVVPDDHPLFAGTFSEWRGNPFAEGLVSESDCLLVVGLRSSTTLTDRLASLLPERTVFAALDEPHTLRLMDGVDALAISDSRLFLSQLLAHADEFRRPPDAPLRARIARHQKAFQKGLSRYMASFESVQPMHFGRVVQELAARLEEDAIVVSGVGNHNVWARTIFPVRNSESFIQEGSWCTMGSELGAGIGAKLVHPQRQVIVVTGDGSLLMSSSDFVTAVEAGANVLVVALNDSRYGMITAMQRMDYGRSYGDEIGWIDFARFAESFGATGIRVESPEELPDAVARALALTAQGPVILDAVCDYQYRWPDLDAIRALGLEEGER